MSTATELDAFRPFGPGWQRRFRRTFLCGMVTFALILGLAQFGFFLGIRDHFRDQVMKVDVELPHEVEIPRGFVFIDIDDEIYREWGSPALLPRDRLAELLHVSLISDAALVILDVDLSREQLEHDRAFEDLFEGLNPEPEAGAPGPDIILVRHLERPPGQMDGPFVLPTSPFDDVVGRSSRLHWAANGFSRSTDGIVRRLRHWEPVCHQGQPMIMPSAALLTAYSVTRQSNALNEEGLSHELASLGLPDCADGQEEPGSGRASLWIGENRVELDSAEPNQTIVFSLPASSGDHQYPTNRSAEGGYAVLTTLEARHLLDPRIADAGAPLLRDRIVVIGGTYADGRDTWLTPIGPMPGAIVLVNAIYSLWQHGTILELSIAHYLLIMGCICAAIFVLLELFRKQVGYEVFDVALGIFTTVLWFVVGYALFQLGAWMEFVLPIWALQMAYHGIKSRELKDALSELSSELSSANAGKPQRSSKTKKGGTRK